HFNVPLSPAADFSVAEDVGCDALRSIHGVLADPPPFMRTHSISAETLCVEYFAWVDQDLGNFRTIESNAKRAVIEALRDAHVPRPENSMVVKLREPRPPRTHTEPHNVEKPDRDRELLDHRFAELRK